MHLTDAVLLSLVLALLAMSPVSTGAPLAATSSALPSAAAPPSKAARADFTLTVALTGARNDKGRLAVGLYASEADFPHQERALRGSMVPIERGKATVTFRGLEPGVYALAVLHDENSNAKMDFNFLGMPLEGYGFSNDAPVLFGPPSFEAAAFKLVARHSRVPIRVRYFLR